MAGGKAQAKHRAEGERHRARLCRQGVAQSHEVGVYVTSRVERADTRSAAQLGTEESIEKG